MFSDLALYDTFIARNKKTKKNRALPNND